MSDERPARPSIADVRAICQPDSVRLRANSEHWVADVYLRQISPYLTRLLLRTSISANGVTYLMILTGIGAAGALLIPGLPGVFIAAILGQFQMLWDCCDGEVARWRETSSPKVCSWIEWVTTRPRDSSPSRWACERAVSPMPAGCKLPGPSLGRCLPFSCSGTRPSMTWCTCLAPTTDFRSWPTPQVSELRKHRVFADCDPLLVCSPSTAPTTLSS